MQPTAILQMARGKGKTVPIKVCLVFVYILYIWYLFIWYISVTYYYYFFMYKVPILELMLMYNLQFFFILATELCRNRVFLYS